MTNQILQVLLLILQLLTWALVGRAILSWIDPGMRWPVTRVLNDATDPLIAPIRSIIPPMGMIDLSFIVAIILLQVLRQLLISALS
ncbi:MAG: YggT family protein [Chloroflexota bacterium]|nr:YggT family protein [Chloroflexota bacterium]